MNPTVLSIICLFLSSGLASLANASTPDESPLVEAKTSNITAHVRQTLLETIQVDEAEREWQFQDGEKKAAHLIDPTKPFCRLQISRLRGVKIEALRHKALKISEISPFSSKEETGVFLSLEFQTGPTNFAGKLNCSKAGQGQQPFTLGELKQALKGIFTFERIASSDQ